MRSLFSILNFLLLLFELVFVFINLHLVEFFENDVVGFVVELPDEVQVELVFVAVEDELVLIWTQFFAEVA